MKAGIVTCEDSFEAVQELFHDKRWSDGLPIVPPTRERIEATLDALGEDPDEVIAVVAPADGELSWAKLVANCVMAGCRTEHVPVVLAAVRGVCAPEFNLAGVQGTTGPHAPAVIVNGPVRDELGINSGTGCFGPGARANAVIGRALRLVLQNVGGAVPGVMDMATFGHPGKYTFCFGEKEEASPWEPLSVERGFATDVSTVTVAACAAPQGVSDNTSTTAERYLRTIRGGLLNAGLSHYYLFGRGQELTLVLGPERARELADAGMSKQDVREFIFHAARLPKHELMDIGMYSTRDWPRWAETIDGDGRIPLVAAPEKVVVVVAGGAGRHSAILPMWTSSVSVTRPIGEPVPTSTSEPGGPDA